MKVTINIPAQVLYMAGTAHHLSRRGCMIVYGWLHDNGRLLWGWTGQEYVFYVEVTP